MADISRHEAQEPASRRFSVRAFLLFLWPPLPIWQRLDTAVILAILYSTIVVLVVNGIGLQLPDWSGVSTLLNGLIIGLLLGFRTQVAYDRWWEGRKLWGQLINESRSLCAKINAMSGFSTASRDEVGRLVWAFALALKHRLRGAPELQRVSGFEKSTDNPPHAPLFLFSRLMKLLQGERATGRITEMDLLLLDPHVRGLMDVCGACERIKNTPISLSYRSLLRHGLVLYLLTTPWLVADHLLWWTIPMMGLFGYFLLGVEFTAEDVEEPFGRDADDLQLSAYCDTIRQAVEQLLGLNDSQQLS
jgi:ion channel-forming bestrophin family protein